MSALVDNREVATGVVTAAALAAAGGVGGIIDRVFIHRKRLRVTTDFDQVVNYKDQSLSIALADGSASVDSIAILRFANAGTQKVELDSPDNDRFRIYFSGADVVGRPAHRNPPAGGVHHRDRVGGQRGAGPRSSASS